jgi:hypothetical protein
MAGLPDSVTPNLWERSVYPAEGLGEPEVEGGTNPDYSGGACDEGNSRLLAL